METFQTSGLETLQRLRERGTEYGIWGLLDISAAEVGEGRVVLTMTTSEAHANHGGILHGGICALLLDEAMALAVHSTMPPGYTATTIDLTTSYRRAGSINASTLTVVGEVTHRGSRLAMASGEATDERGKVLATSTMSALVRNIAAEIESRRSKEATSAEEAGR